MRTCIMVAALLLLSACSHDHTIVAPESDPLVNPLPGNTYRGKPAVRVLQWAFTDSHYTIITTLDGSVTGTSSGHYSLFSSTTQNPPAWSGMRGWFEAGSYLRDGAWHDNADALNFAIPFQWSPGVATIDGATYYLVAPQ